MTKEEALLDLKAKVAAFMDDAAKLALDRIDKLQAAGAGIAQDHIDNGENYQIPRDFMAAFADEIKFQYGMVLKHASTEQKKRIKNYSLMM